MELKKDTDKHTGFCLAGRVIKIETEDGTVGLPCCLLALGFRGVEALDGPIRANRFADSRESSVSHESFQGSQTEPHFCESQV